MGGGLNWDGRIYEIAAVVSMMMKPHLCRWEERGKMRFTIPGGNRHAMGGFAAGLSLPHV